MKVHSKKKAYRAMCKKMAVTGYINNASGQFIARGQAADNAMKRDYYPQGGSK